MDDFIIGKEYNLNVSCPVDDNGFYTEEAEEFKGQFVLEEGNENVIKKLEMLDRLILLENYNHKYPYDWRTKKPIIVRTTKQWFAQLSNIKQIAISELEKVKMHPKISLHRLEAFLEKRNEWCISRQRVWGVPIPAFYHKETNKLLANEETIRHVIEIFKIKGSDSWWELPISELLPKSYNSEQYYKGNDTLDVWFDSGSSWYSVLKPRNISLPVDLYSEGSDQHRFFLNFILGDGKTFYKK
jgi:isoleucyl-tRNA synthetase